MRKLTNLQLNVIVDKIYNDLSKKVAPVNEARLEAVDMGKLLAEDKVHARLFRLAELKQSMDSLSREIESLNDSVRQDLYGSHGYYHVPSYKDYVDRLKNQEANLIFINRGEIEASVVLSDIGDLESLISGITNGITKDIPELN